MNPHDIKAELAKRGWSMTRVAEEVGVSRPMVSHVIYGRFRSRKVATQIASIVDRPVADLWPAVYGNRRVA